MYFVLGLGTQKAGTTWLHRHLSSMPQVDMGLIKEYRIWETRYLSYGHLTQPTLKNFLRRPQKEWLRWRMLRRPGVYEAYFSQLIGSEITHTGDITPDYSGLNAVHLSEIRERLIDAGFKPKVVYLLRDPVERCWSAARYYHQSLDPRRAKNYLATADNQGLTAEALLIKHVEDDRFQAHTRYESIVSSIESAFQPDECFFAIYEELFTDSVQSELHTFLDLPLSANNTGVINASPEASISPELSASLRSQFATTYEFCYQRFPQTKDLWSSS